MGDGSGGRRWEGAAPKACPTIDFSIPDITNHHKFIFYIPTSTEVVWVDRQDFESGSIGSSNKSIGHKLQEWKYNRKFKAWNRN